MKEKNNDNNIQEFLHHFAKVAETKARNVKSVNTMEVLNNLIPNKRNFTPFTLSTNQSIIKFILASEVDSSSLLKAIWTILTDAGLRDLLGDFFIAFTGIDVY